jgi:phosphoribosylglycinamide formyltransferase 2
MLPPVLEKSRDIARKITDNLGGRGIFGVELFIKGNEVYFSEVSPRPHDTGLVTLVTQDLSEFALHVRAILGLPVFPPVLRTAGGSSVILAEQAGKGPVFDIDEAANHEETLIRLFGKPECHKKRRMGVVLVADADPIKAAALAKERASRVRISFPD